MAFIKLRINLGSGAGPRLNHSSNYPSTLLIPGQPILLSLYQISPPTLSSSHPFTSLLHPHPYLHPFILPSLITLTSLLPPHPYLHPFILPSLITSTSLLPPHPYLHPFILPSLITSSLPTSLHPPFSHLFQLNRVHIPLMSFPIGSVSGVSHQHGQKCTWDGIPTLSLHLPSPQHILPDQPNRHILHPSSSSAFISIHPSSIVNTAWISIKRLKIHGCGLVQLVNDTRAQHSPWWSSLVYISTATGCSPAADMLLPACASSSSQYRFASGGMT